MALSFTQKGFSTGLPERLQLTLLRTLPGLENCSMLRPSYAVEYDYLPAYQCSRSLMTKKFDGLFFSGQVNGTTGYEEAAAQVSFLCVLVRCLRTIFFSFGWFQVVLHINIEGNQSPITCLIKVHIPSSKYSYNLKLTKAYKPL